MGRDVWAGAKWYIGGPTATTPLASETNWTEIGDARAATGEAGKTWQTTDATVFSPRTRVNAKTVFDAGQLDLTMIRRHADAGQAALSAACDDAEEGYNFMVLFDDNPDPPPGAGSGSELRLSCKVLSFVHRAGNPNALRDTMSRLDIEDVLEVAAA